MLFRSIFLLLAVVFSAQATPFPTPLIDNLKIDDKQRKLLFSRLNLNLPELKECKIQVENKNYKKAAKLLLDYFRNRKNQFPRDNFPTAQASKGKALSPKDAQTAANGMKHIIIAQPAHKAFFGGKVIEWYKLPYSGYENKVQIHRMHWWPAMAKLYWSSDDQKVAKEWMEQYLSWYNTSPINNKYAWRTLEVGHRLQLFTDLFAYYLNSPEFTADFMVQFLNDIYRHGDYIFKHGANKSNWLLMESERSIYAGLFFPEFKESNKWIKRAIGKILPEIKKQVYADGMHNELSSCYHVLAINMFQGALANAAKYGKTDQFPKEYSEAIRKMLYAKIKWTFPDWNVMRFGDAWTSNKKKTINYYRNVIKWFPDDNVFRWFATEGKEGCKPPFSSVEMPYSGFYIMRSGWNENDTCMILKCGPDGGFHDAANDNSFELYIKGRYFFPNPGCYTYGGNKKLNGVRFWMKSSRLHNTVTLDDLDNPKKSGRKVLWKIEKNIEVCVTENPAPKNCKIRRTVFFVDKKFFVIVDQLIGKAEGNASLHYQLHENWNPKINSSQKLLVSTFKDGNNIALKLWASEKSILQKTDSVVSYIYNKKINRKGIRFNCRKPKNKSVSFASVIYPVEGIQVPEIKIIHVYANDKMVETKLKINNKNYDLSCKL